MRDYIVKRSWIRGTWRVVRVRKAVKEFSTKGAAQEEADERNGLDVNHHA